MYNVYQHWDPLQTCIVGKSYPPEFYNFIQDPKTRSVMEKIAIETEEDYQKLILLLESFNVKVLRPDVGDNIERFLVNGKYLPPPMTPRDYSIVLGNDVYFKASTNNTGATTPSYDYEKFSDIDKFVWKQVIEDVQAEGNNLFNLVHKDMHNFNSASAIRCGKDLYIGTDSYGEDKSSTKKLITDLYPEYRVHVADTGGHSDGVYCPVKPGLIVCHNDMPQSYAELFPDWEVVYVPAPGWAEVSKFLELKTKNQGKWWVPGEESNDSFTDFVENWLGHWVGYVEESVFDVNILVIDEKNIICNDYTSYNKHVFDAFERHGITPHIINFRHRHFWDGGIHCVTSDLHRISKLKDYFPNR
jgi:hypothetical protein